MTLLQPFFSLGFQYHYNEKQLLEYHECNANFSYASVIYCAEL